jgi:hypothetical protein
MTDGIDTDRLRCECGQVLCKDLDIRTGIDGDEIAVCANCGNCAPLPQEFPLDPSGDNPPAESGKLKGQ